MITDSEPGLAPVPVGLAVGAPRLGRDRLARWVALAVGLIAGAAFLPILHNGFVADWDDRPNFLDNKAFRGLGFRQLRWAWTTTWQGSYQPLPWMLLEVEYSLVGLEPSGYHLASLMLHSLNAVLFYALTCAVIARALPGLEPGVRWAISTMSGVVAVLFAVHPLRVEVVAWASSQAYLPCAGFVMMSVLAYLRAWAPPGRRHHGWYWASVGLFAAALGCKGLAVGLPLVLMILDVVLLGRRVTGWSSLGVWVEKLPYLALAGAAVFMSIKAKGDPPRLIDPLPPSAWRMVERVAVAGYGLGYYARQTVWPQGLSAYHYRPERIDLAQPRFAGSLAAVAIVGVTAYFARRRWPAILAALLAYASLLAPTLGLVWYDLMLVADRHAYLATPPLFVLAAGWLVQRVADSRRPRALALVLVSAGLVASAVLARSSWALCRTWRDSDTLVAHGLKAGSGRDALLESYHGLDLVFSGRMAEGMAHLRQAIQLDPADPDPHENLGVMLSRRGDLPGAIAHFAEAARLAPDRFDLRHHLGLALALQGRFDEAAGELAVAVRLRPGHAQAHVSFGDVLVALKRPEEATAQFAQALRLDPDHPGARRGLEQLNRGSSGP
jgi:tetratricopeptide (TPR) repeat protein